MSYQPPEYQANNPAGNFPGANFGQPNNTAAVNPGVPNPQQQNDPWARSNLVAALLALILGAFGAHRFYLGYTGTGVAMLLVTIFTLGLGIIWPIVEGLMILSGAEYFRTDATGRPLRP